MSLAERFEKELSTARQAYLTANDGFQAVVSLIVPLTKAVIEKDSEGLIDRAVEMAAILISMAEIREASLTGASNTDAYRVFTEGKDALKANSSKRLKAVNNSDTLLALSTTSNDDESKFELQLAALSPEARELVERWNGILSLPRVTDLKNRRNVIYRALKSGYFKLKWREGLHKLAHTPFLTGQGKRRWKANFDWFIAPGNLQKIIAGDYDEVNSPQIPPQQKDYTREEI